MDTDAVHDATVPIEDVTAGEPEAELSNVDLHEGISSSGDIMRELESSGEVLTRVELDLACSSEKLVNLNVLMMHVATRESDFEVFVSEKEHILSDSVEKALEFDLLSGILDSEVRELDNFMPTLQTEIINAREIVSSFEHLGEVVKEMEDKLYDSEESLKQSLDQLSEIRVQSAKFQRMLLSFHGQENWEGGKGVDILENGEFSNLNAKIKMQTAEQQRHILRMLEKSLARELDLEKKVAESRLIEEELKLRLHSSEHETFCMEEEAAVVWERLFETDNATEVLMGISKEILGRLQIVQFNLNSSIQREGELRSKLQDSVEKLKAEDSALQKLESSSPELNEFLVSQTNTLKTSLGEAKDELILANSEAFTLTEKVSSLENQLKESEFQLLNVKASADGSRDLYSEIHEMGNVIEDLKEKVSKAESRAEGAKAKCKLLTETNMQLNEELGILKSSGITSEKVDSLERQLREYNIQLQHAVASAEASLEKQSMLYTAIGDMENLIEDLKLKVSKAESRAESAEEKCIILSKSNSDLNEELNFVKVRMECLEASLHQVEETKMATAKDISIRTKVITELVMQLALERERLHKQISSLTKQNKILIENLQHSSKDPSVTMSHDSKRNGKEFLLSKHDFSTTTYAKESEEEVTKFSTTRFELDKKPKNVSVGETEIGPADSTSKLETLRNIDARQLNLKYVFIAILVLVISALAVFLFQHPNGQL
uniref:Putative WPP domain-interacting tail-anchored protein 1 n=1 Tax=Davidia involucrata TaxID=16924 RepID=A0A5B7ACU0_DAVIN